MTLLQVETGFACAGVVVEKGVVVEAAPIYGWMVGKRWAEVRQWRRIVYVRKCREPREDHRTAPDMEAGTGAGQAVRDFLKS